MSEIQISLGETNPVFQMMSESLPQDELDVQTHKSVPPHPD